MPRNPRRLVGLDQGRQYSIGPLTFDREGAGATSYTMDWSYFGFAASMRPSMFLRLAFRKVDLPIDRQTERMAQGVREGVAFAPLYLRVEETDRGHSLYHVTGHEGRHRANQILTLVGDVPVPVVMRIPNVRARNLSPELISTINRGLVSQDGDYVHGPIFEGEAIYYADGYSDERHVKLPDHVEPYVSEEDQLLDLLLSRNPSEPKVKYKVVATEYYQWGVPVLKTRLVKVQGAPQAYQTPDGRFYVSGAPDVESPSQTIWTWEDEIKPQRSGDWYLSKWSAVNAMCYYMVENGLASI